MPVLIVCPCRPVTNQGSTMSEDCKKRVVGSFFGRSALSLRTGRAVVPGWHGSGTA